jgi:hypothetical protein
VSDDDKGKNDNGSAVQANTTHSSTSSSASSSIPKVRLSSCRAWSVSLSPNGTVQGLPDVAAPSHQVLNLLKEVVIFAEQVLNNSRYAKGGQEVGPSGCALFYRYLGMKGCGLEGK